MLSLLAERERERERDRHSFCFNQHMLTDICTCCAALILLTKKFLPYNINTAIPNILPQFALGMLWVYIVIWGQVVTMENIFFAWRSVALLCGAEAAHASKLASYMHL